MSPVPGIAFCVVTVLLVSTAEGQDCSSFPCRNGGTCRRTEVSFICECTSEYTDPMCSTLKFEARIGVLQVLADLPIITRAPSDVIRTQTPQLVLSPDVLGSHPRTYQWTLNGSVLDPATRPKRFMIDTEGNLIVSPVSLADEGDYQLVVSNEYATMFSRKIKLKFAVTGTFLSKASLNLSVTENEPYLIRCPPRSYSYGVTYDWHLVGLQGVPLSNEPHYAPRVLREPSGDLLFSYVEKNDSAALSPIRCRMTGLDGMKQYGPDIYFYNKVSTTQPSPITETTQGPLPTQITGVAPKFYTRPHAEYNLASGEQSYINCTAGGRPTPKILWYKNNGLLKNTGDEFELQLYNRTLRLGSLSSSAHDGNYKCVAENSLGTLETSFGINVIDKVTPLYSNPQHPGYDIRAGEHGGNVTLSCNTTGDPITREWFFNGVAVNDSSKLAGRWFVSTSTGDLTLKNLKLEDFGFYQCVAANLVSENDRRSLLVVTGAPLPPVNVSVSDCANHSTTIKWDVRLLTGLQPPTGFIIESTSLYREIEAFSPAFTKVAEIQDGAARSHVVNDLQPYTYVSFRVRAKNNIGVGFPRIVTKGEGPCITLPTPPAKYPQDLRGFPDSGDGHLRVQWTPLHPLDWSGPNCIYRIFFRQKSANAAETNATTRRCRDRDIFITNLQRNEFYDISIQAENDLGAGPRSPLITSLAGQKAPQTPPRNVVIVDVQANSVELKWSPILVDENLARTVDGYVISAWTGPIQIASPQESEEPTFGFTIPDHAVNSYPINSTRGSIYGLASLTKYNLVVSGYNTGGMGPPSVLLETTTLDIKDSFYILSTKITNEIFTEDLKDKTSNEYIRLSQKIKEEIEAVYRSGLTFLFKGAEVLALRNGSVLADVQLSVASPNMSAVFEVVKSERSLGNLTLDQNGTTLVSEPDIQNVLINASDVVVNVSGRIILTCTVIGGPADLSILWYKDVQEVPQLIEPNNRTKIQSKTRYSKLIIRNVRPNDWAKYRCVAGKGNQNLSRSVIVGVLPVLDIQPRAVTKLIGERVTFSCSVHRRYSQFTLWIVEITNQSRQRHQGGNFTLSDLQIPDSEETLTRTFVCEITALAERKQLLATSDEVKLTITRPAAPKCPAELLDGVSWPLTASGTVDLQPCPDGAYGTVSRSCLETAQWEAADFLGCSSPLFVRLGSEAESLTEGFVSGISGSELLSELVDATLPIPAAAGRPQEIYGGDLSIAVDILVRLADYNAEQGALRAENDVENFPQVASNLLEYDNAKTWLALEEAGRGRSQSLVKTMDVFGLGVIKTFTGSQKSASVRAKNLLMRLDQADPDSPLRQDGLTVLYNQSSIYVPPDVFGPSSRTRNATRVVSFVYLTLNDVLPLVPTANEMEKNNNSITANTTIVSTSIDPRPSDTLDSPIKIVLENRRIDVPSGFVPEGTCVFWRPDSGEPAVWQRSGCRIVASETDAKITTCECDHLTVFAATMDPFGATISAADKRALEIISIVGCSISLLAVLVTIAVTLFFWKILKGPRSKVLLNLCAAIAISCVLVILESSMRDNKDGCTVVAVLLHYFLLALFSWMLCEGALLYILLVKVFGGGAEHKVKYFYMLGWGFPAVVVAISLAVTQVEGYGTTDVCWLDFESGLIWAFIAPAVVVILLNIIVFILVIRQMMGTANMQDKSQVDRVRAGVKATAVVLPLLGITWIFGLLAFNSAAVAFKYIFAIFNSLQGLMIFIFHCVLSKQVKDAIKRRHKKGNTGAYSNPNSKQSLNLKMKHFVGTQDDDEMKRSHKPRNHYEMAEGVPSEKSDTLPTTVSFSSDKARIHDDPDVNTQPAEGKTETPTKGILTTSDEAYKPRPAMYENSEIQEGEEFDDSARKISSVLLLPRGSKAGRLGRESVADEFQKYDQITNTDQGRDGIDNCIYEKAPDEYQRPLGDELLRSHGKRPSSSSSSPSDLHHERLPVEVTATFQPVEISWGRELPDTGVAGPVTEAGHEYEEMNELFPQEGRCYIDAFAAEGAMPLNSKRPSVLPSARVGQPRTATDDGDGDDQDFKDKMRKQRIKVDTLQRAADAFSSTTHQRSPPQRAWHEIRQEIRSGNYKETTNSGGQKRPGNEGNPKDLQLL